jgi:hypothetical protein
MRVLLLVVLPLRGLMGLAAWALKAVDRAQEKADRRAVREARP